LVFCIGKVTKLVHSNGEGFVLAVESIDEVQVGSEHSVSVLEFIVRIASLELLHP
jgi:hypothetical protein